MGCAISLLRGKAGLVSQFIAIDMISQWRSSLGPLHAHRRTEWHWWINHVTHRKIVKSWTVPNGITQRFWMA
jgi:hypothetical protein